MPLLDGFEQMPFGDTAAGDIICAIKVSFRIRVLGSPGIRHLFIEGIVWGSGARLYASLSSVTDRSFRSTFRG
jgi:hypothetical protein